MTESFLSKNDLAKLESAFESTNRSIYLVLNRKVLGHDEFRSRLETFAQEICIATKSAVGWLEVSKEKARDLPTLSVRIGERDLVRYRAVPEGPELPPFLEFLTSIAKEPSANELSSQLTALENPVEISVYIAPGCPNCPHGVRAVLNLAALCENVTATIIDTVEFAETASEYNIQSVPTTVVDEKLTLVGVRPAEELVNELMRVEQPDGGKRIFESLVKAGRLSKAEALLLDGSCLAAFADLWNSSTLESRISMSLIAQSVLEKNQTALDDLVSLILPALREGESSLKGDTADLLGQIGHSSAEKELEHLASDSDPDIVEAASDAIESIRQRTAGDQS